MKQKPTMKDVAQHAGVSVMTVSRAFKEDASVSSNTRKKVREIAEAIGYRFDVTASNLRLQRSNFVAVTIPSLNNANFAETVEAITAELSRSGYQVLLGYTNYELKREEELIAELLSRRPEAIILTGGTHTLKAQQMLETAGIPVIETWDMPKNPIQHAVGFSNSAAMGPLVDHLVEQGRDKIAFVGGDTLSDTRGRDRRFGFVKAMRKHNLQCHRLISSGPPQNPMQGGAGSIQKMLNHFPDTQAMICVSDLVAFGALSECQRRNIQVPKDLAIAGFGAYDIGKVSFPTLTTIDPDPSAIGLQSAKLVVDLLLEKQMQTSFVLHPRLNVGGSTSYN